MRVKTKPGIKCPIENNPRKYITETPVEVPNSSYYRRLIADGSLVVVPETPVPAQKGGKKK